MVRIIIDSTTDVAEAIADKVKIVPLTIRFGEEEYVDRVTIDHKTFYEKLIESDVLPITSQATPGDFGPIFEEVAKAGDTAVVLTLSSKLSGTYQSAMIAAGDYPGKIFVVDGKSVAIGTGILAELAVTLAEAGKAAEEIAQTLEAERENVRVIALLDTLEYLRKGGRISATVAVAGSLLSIKPVVNLQDGAVNILGKARGSKQGNNLLVKEIENAGGVDFQKPLLLGYTGLNDDLLQKYIRDSAHLWEGHSDALRIAAVGSVVGTHAGPGVVAAAFFKK